MTAAALIWLAAVTALAPPATDSPPIGPLSVPLLVPRSAATIQAGWDHVKDVKTLSEQQGRIADRRLDTAFCSDTLSMRALLSEIDLSYELRDLVRLRHEARPEMVALLIRASDHLRRSDPGATITIGDIAQNGCGQIRYGTVVTFEPPVLSDGCPGFLDRATLAYGVPTLFEPAEPDDFLDEFPRFADVLGPVWVERTATGQTPTGDLRIETRRFEGSPPLSAESMARLLIRTAKRFRGRDVTWDTVRHTDIDGQVLTARRARWVDDGEGRWAELVLRPTRSIWPLRADKILRVREATLDPGKPTSLKFEERYVFDFDGEAGVRVVRMLLEYEAHHASHLSGLDADLSYVTHRNQCHFMPDVALIDRRASWHWMGALHRASEELAIPLSALFVDRVIWRAFKSLPEAKKSDPTWRKIHISPGHDSHVHVRIGAAPRYAGKSLAEIIALVRKR